ncbi:MAG TPA: hypothetical protein DCQ06_10475 [Myxococcales bacterium]|nr:hypothetical protein [Myxococcales bacterium]HAN32011.1 hypothetical protein [Myxococcales bacterium]
MDLILSPQELEVARAHAQAVNEGRRTYDDPSTGFIVMTQVHHLRRGCCCGNVCRHCPFDWTEVSEERIEGLGQARRMRRLRLAQIERVLAEERR